MPCLLITFSIFTVSPLKYPLLQQLNSALDTIKIRVDMKQCGSLPHILCLVDMNFHQFWCFVELIIHVNNTRQNRTHKNYICSDIFKNFLSKLVRLPFICLCNILSNSLSHFTLWQRCRHFVITVKGVYWRPTSFPPRHFPSTCLLQQTPLSHKFERCSASLELRYFILTVPYIVSQVLNHYRVRFTLCSLKREALEQYPQKQHMLIPSRHVWLKDPQGQTWVYPCRQIWTCWLLQLNESNTRATFSQRKEKNNFFILY